MQVGWARVDSLPVIGTLAGLGGGNSSAPHDMAATLRFSLSIVLRPLERSSVRISL